MIKSDTTSSVNVPELEGFTVYKPGNNPKLIFLSTRSSFHMILSEAAWNIIGNPAHVNVFTDENHRRVMVKVAEESWKNALPVSRCGKARGVKDSGLRAICVRMFGETRVYGHLITDDALIFDEVQNGK